MIDGEMLTAELKSPLATLISPALSVRKSLTLVEEKFYKQSISGDKNGYLTRIEQLETVWSARRKPYTAIFSGDKVRQRAKHQIGP
jgi:hypothetical protein